MRIGLTGGIAAGKSTAARRLRELGAVIVDYDVLAREVVAPGGAALPAIVSEFGPESLNSDGTLNRPWLAEHIFGPSAEPGARERLDAIEHPLIYAAAAKAEQAAGPVRIIVHDVPLLAEVLAKGEIPFSFDHIITVEAPEEERIGRMVTQRGMTREQAQNRISHQSTRAEREAIADAVIDTSLPVEHTFEILATLVREWTE